MSVGISIGVPIFTIVDAVLLNGEQYMQPLGANTGVPHESLVVSNVVAVSVVGSILKRVVLPPPIA